MSEAIFDESFYLENYPDVKVLLLDNTMYNLRCNEVVKL